VQTGQVGLANRPIKPLWHLSSNVSNTLAQFSSWLGALLVHYNRENVAATRRQGGLNTNHSPLLQNAC